MLNLIKNVQTIAFTVGGGVLGAVVSTVLVFLCGVKPSLLLFLPVLLFGLAGYILYTQYLSVLIDNIISGLFDEKNED